MKASGKITAGMCRMPDVLFALVAAMRLNNVLYHKSSRAACSIQADCQQNYKCYF